MIRPPRRFTVMGQPFSVSVLPGVNLPDDWSDGQVGECDYAKGLVTMSRHQSPHSMLDTYLHESLHAISMLSGANRFMHDAENVVSILAPQLLDFIRSNPRVVAYLTQKVAA